VISTAPVMEGEGVVCMRTLRLEGEKVPKEDKHDERSESVEVGGIASNLNFENPAPPTILQSAVNIRCYYL